MTPARGFPKGYKSLLIQGTAWTARRDADPLLLSQGNPLLLPLQSCRALNAGGILQISFRICSSPPAYLGTELLGVCSQIQCRATMRWAVWPWGLLSAGLGPELLKKHLHAPAVCLVWRWQRPRAATPTLPNWCLIHGRLHRPGCCGASPGLAPCRAPPSIGLIVLGFWSSNKNVLAGAGSI